jgi:serine/threonine-protein phosphatase 2B regulatory subunit
MGHGGSGAQSSAPADPSAEAYRAISEETGFGVDELRVLFPKYSRIASSQQADGKIDITEFKAALALSNDGFADRLFRAFDSDQSRDVDFAEFVRGMQALSDRATVAQKARFCFRVYDADSNGTIDREELRAILQHSLIENSPVKLSDEQIARMIDRTYDKMDTDADGGISFEEFEREAAKNPSILACSTICLDGLLTA